MQLRGMEEGIHNMQIGGKRRIIIPKELGYTVAGLGPYPADSGNRNKLANVSDDAIKLGPSRAMNEPNTRPQARQTFTLALSPARGVE